MKDLYDAARDRFSLDRPIFWQTELKPNDSSSLGAKAP